MESVMHRTIAALVVLTIALAGCSGGKDPVDDVPADVPVVTDATGKKVVDEKPAEETVTTESGWKVAANKAVLFGRVHDDFNFSLKGAFVSIIGTAHFTKTNETGHYVLDNVTVGTFDVRFEMDLFKARQERVTLGAGTELRVDAEMLPVQPRSPGFTPHFHNPWEDATEFLVMDHDISINQGLEPGSIKNPTPSAARAASCGVSSCRFAFTIPERDDGKPATIWPGTKEARITLTWSGTAMTIGGTRLDYAHPDMNILDRIESPVVANGEAITIPVTREMQDHGHAQWTGWRFDAVAVNSPTDPGFVQGTLNVKIQIVRGDVVLDPPHEDFWQGRSQISWEFRHIANTGVPPTPADETGPGHVFTIPRCFDDSPPECVPLIPPGTMRLEVRLAWLPNAQGQRAPFDYSLTYKAADQPPDTPAADFRSPTLVEEDLGEDWRVYEMSIDREADGFYMSRSDWLFKWNQDTGLPMNLAQNQFNFDVSITAFKAP